MSLVPGDYGSYIRRQQSEQTDEQLANPAYQARQNLRNRLANMGPMGPIITQLPTDGPYANRSYQMPFVRQAPMMDMRGIGGLFAGLFGGARGGYGGGYSPQAPQFRPSPRYMPQGEAYQLPMSDEQRAQSRARAEASLQEAGISGDDVPEYAAPPSLQPPPFQGGFGRPQGGFQPQGGFGQPQSGPRQGLMFRQPLMGNTSQPQGGFGQPPMGGAPGGKGGAKGGGTFGQPSYGMQARYSSPFGNLF